MYILATSSFESFWKLISVLLIFVFVLVLCLWTTKFVGGYAKQRSTNKNLSIIETISVGPGKMISLVEAGKVYLVVSIGKDDVRLLATLEREQLKDLSFEDMVNDQVVKPINQETFQEMLDKIKDKFPKK